MSSIRAISISDRKGVRKNNVDSASLVAGFGLADDAHGGRWHRQVSLLAQESIDTMRRRGLDVVAGNFAENLTTEGIDLTALGVGRHIRIGDSELVISQLGKICHVRCAIFRLAGDCVMPREGIFAVVRKGGPIKVGDPVTVLERSSPTLAVVARKDLIKDHGEPLGALAMERLQPGFVRLDAIGDKEGATLPAILGDLTGIQKIATIIVYDPDGGEGLHLAGYQRLDRPGAVYRCAESIIHHCRTMGEVGDLAP